MQCEPPYRAAFLQNVSCTTQLKHEGQMRLVLGDVPYEGMIDYG